MKILVVEDDPSSRSLVEAVLTGLGHEPRSCEDGLEAWEAFQEERYPVVISDWMMPRLDGLELCGRIRAHPTETYTYVILLTGKVEKGSYQRAIAAGVDDFLPKPLDQELLEARLTVAGRIVGLHHHMRRLESLLHVCAWCKQIREGDAWVSLERYVGRNVSELTHGICPACYARLAGELDATPSTG